MSKTPSAKWACGARKSIRAGKETAAINTIVSAAVEFNTPVATQYRLRVRVRLPKGPLQLGPMTLTLFMPHPVPDRFFNPGASFGRPLCGNWNSLFALEFEKS